MSANTDLVVAIDSQTLVWGIRQQGNDDQNRRAIWLFEQLDSQRAQIIVPTIVASEYLTHVAKADHAAVLAELSSRFVLPPFDVRCASLAAELFRLNKSDTSKSKPGWRNCLRSDTLIIATAKIHGARIFYTGDNNCRKVASTIMDACDLPNQPSNLFGYSASDED